MSHGFGCIPSEYDVRDYVLNVIDEQLPEQFIRAPVAVKNQGSSSTCTAHVIAELVEYHNLVDTGVYDRFSTEFIYGFRNIDRTDDYIGDGMRIRDALRIAQTYGDVEYKILPENNEYEMAMRNVKNAMAVQNLYEKAYENRITSYYKVRSEDELKYALIHHGPVAAGMRWYETMKVVADGKVTYEKCKKVYGHAVLIIGYNSYGVTVQNSWGDSWGDHGVFTLSWDQYDELVTEAYGVTDDIKVTKRPMKKHRILSKVINFLVRAVTK